MPSGICSTWPRSKAKAFIVYSVHGRPGRKEPFHTSNQPVRCVDVQLRLASGPSVSPSNHANWQRCWWLFSASSPWPACVFNTSASSNPNLFGLWTNLLQELFQGHGLCHQLPMQRARAHCPWMLHSLAGFRLGTPTYVRFCSCCACGICSEQTRAPASQHYRWKKTSMHVCFKFHHFVMQKFTSVPWSQPVSAMAVSSRWATWSWPLNAATCNGVRPQPLPDHQLEVPHEINQRIVAVQYMISKIFENATRHSNETMTISPWGCGPDYLAHPMWRQQQAAPPPPRCGLVQPPNEEASSLRRYSIPTRPCKKAKKKMENVMERRGHAPSWKENSKP